MRPLISSTRVRRIADAVIAGGVGLFLAAVGADDQPDGRPGGLIALGVALGLVQGAALWWRRVHPGRVMIVALVGGLGTQLLAPSLVIPFAGLFAIGSLAAARPPPVSLPALAGLIAVTAVNFLTASAGDTWFAIVVAVLPWALGETIRNRRVAIEEGARRAVTDERARIAREMHDVIAHSVSVIVVQAGAAEDVFDARPDQARAALRSIESAGRDALRELRRLLAAVRPGPGLTSASSSVSSSGLSSRPAPGLADVDELAAPLRAAGLAVDVRREGTVRDLPAGIDLSAYRIVQEALTNTLRHAHASTARVTLCYSAEALDVTVTDDGRGGAVSAPASVLGGEASGGLGIAGMRERAAMVGGRLDAGRLPAGGFRVAASLPLEPAT